METVSSGTTKSSAGSTSLLERVMEVMEIERLTGLSAGAAGFYFKEGTRRWTPVLDVQKLHITFECSFVHNLSIQTMSLG